MRGVDGGEEGKEKGGVTQEGCKVFLGKDLQQEVVYLEICTLNFSSTRKMYVLKFPPRGNSKLRFHNFLVSIHYIFLTIVV